MVATLFHIWAIELNEFSWKCVFFSVCINSLRKQDILFGTFCRDKTKMKTAILSIAVFLSLLAYGSHCHAAAVVTPPTKAAVSAKCYLTVYHLRGLDSGHIRGASNTS